MISVFIEIRIQDNISFKLCFIIGREYNLEVNGIIVLRQFFFFFFFKVILQSRFEADKSYLLFIVLVVNRPMDAPRPEGREPNRYVATITNVQD